MQEIYFHEAAEDGGTRRTDRLRGVERTSDDGYKLSAYIRAEAAVSLKLESRDWGRAEDILPVDDRVALAKLLLSGLPIEKVREALPRELFTTEWALQVTDTEETWLSEDDGVVWDSREAVEADLAKNGPYEGDIRIVRRETTNWVEG